MPPIWKPYDIEVYLYWINVILDEASDELNDWEIKFIDNIQMLLQFNGKLTRAQSDSLEKIYTKYTK